MPRGLRFTISAFDKTARAFKSIEDRTTRLQKKFKGVTRSLGGIGKGLIAAFAGAGITAIVRATDQIDKFSTRLGISTAALSELKFAGEQTGVEFNQLALGLQRMNRRVSEAAQGMGEAQNALKELGLDAVQLNNLPLEQQFNKVADALNGVETQSDKVRLAFKLFDSEGVALIQTMEGGSRAVNELRAELRALGGVIDADASKKLAALNDAWNRVTVAVEGTGRQLLAFLAPAIEVVLNLISKLIAFIGRMGNALRKAQLAVAAFGVQAGRFLGLINDDVARESIKGLAKQWRTVSGEVGSANDAVKTFNASSSRAAAALNRAAVRPRSNASSRLSSNRKTINKVRTDLDELNTRAEDTALNIRDVFKESLRGVGDEFNTLGDVAENVYKRIQGTILDRTANAAADQVFNAGQGALNGALQNIFRPSGGFIGPVQPDLGSFSDFFGGFFANGGNFQAGKPIVVGERGPELIMPRSAGTVIPNERLPNTGGMNVTINVRTPDANSFRQSQGQIAADAAMAIQRANRNL